MEDALTVYNRIGYGKENGVKRPSSQSVDRVLRKMIEKANAANDCIIAGKYGYYRPDVRRQDEIMEAKKIFASELHRARAILKKRLGMIRALGEWREIDCLLIAEQKEQPGNENLQKCSADMDIVVEEDNSTPGQMVMRMS